MALLEVGTIVELVFTFALEQSGVGEKIKEKLRGNPAKDAFARALQKALTEFESNHQIWVQAGFDKSFLEREATPVLAACLLRSHGPDATELAFAWAKSLSKEAKHERIKAIRPVLREFLQTLEREMCDQPDLAELMRDRQAFADPNRPSFSTRYDYLSWLLDQHTYLDLRGTLQTYRDVRLKLAEVFVSLTGEAEKTREQDRDLERLLRDKAAHDSHEEAMDEARMRLRERRTEPAKTVELAQASKQYAKLVLLGDPGSGKSTLLRYLAHMHATAQRDGAVSAGKDGKLGTTLLPIFVRIADFVERPNWRSESLSDALPHLLSSQECNAAGLATLLDTELAQGKCLVLLDGLDEVLTAADRNVVVQKIENLLRGHGAGNRYVVTSRVAGYLAAPLTGDFATFTVQDMSEAQITQFLNGYCVAIENAQTPDLSAEQRKRNAQREIEALRKVFKDNGGVARLAKNPLMLRTIALIHRSGQTLPRKRSELYKLTADTLARTWDEAKGIRNLDKIELLREELLTPILSAFAYWLHREKPSGVASEAETRREIGAAYAKRKGLAWDAEQPSAEIERAVSDFLQVVRERTGLLIERAPHRYGFMHLTFEEYYAARHMVARASQRAKLIRQHLHDPRWQEPILLALGHVAADSPDDAAELIEQAILAHDGEFAPSAYEDVLGRDFLFALRCAGDGILPNPAVQQQLAAQAADEVLYGHRLGDYNVYWRHTLDLFALLKETPLHSMLAQKSLLALWDESWNVRYRAIASLCELGEANEWVVSRLLELSQDDNWTVRFWVTEALGKLGVVNEKVIDHLLELLQDEDMVVRLNAASSFVELDLTYEKIEKVLNFLLGMLSRNQSSSVRASSAESLGRLGIASDNVVRELLELLQDEEWRVRYPATESLGQLGVASEQVVSVLFALLRDEAGYVRHCAAKSLKQLSINNKEIIDRLSVLLRDEDSDVRSRVAESLIDLGIEHESVLNTLLGLLHDVNQVVRVRVAASLGKLREPHEKTVDGLLELLKDEDSAVRSSAVESLGLFEIASDKVITELLKMLEDRSWGMRSQVVTSLGRLGNDREEVVNVLNGLLQDKDSDVCFSAAKSLVRLGGISKNVIIALLGLLRNEDGIVLSPAVESLVKLAQANRQSASHIAQQLRTMLDETKDNNRQEIYKALDGLAAAGLI